MNNLHYHHICVLLSVLTKYIGSVLIEREVYRHFLKSGVVYIDAVTVAIPVARFGGRS